MPTIVKMPKWGLTMTAGTVVGWISPEGAEISEGDPLLTVETEKAVDDVPAPAGGILYKIVAEPGSEVAVSAPVAVILAAGETLTDEDLAQLVAAASPAAAISTESGAASHAARESRAATRDKSGRINASPAARKLATELGVDLSTVEATGPGGRITSDDVELAGLESGGSALEERDIALVDGRHIHALFAGPRNAGKLLFIHGLGGSLSTWQLVLGGLAEQWRVIAVDLPGHGQSARLAPETTDYSIAGHAAAVAEAMHAASVSDTIVIGHSLGGAVVLELTSTAPELVRGLVLIDCAGLGEEISGDLIALMGATPGEETARGLLELFIEDRKLVAPRAIEEMASNQNASGAWDAQQATANAAFSGGKQAGYSPGVLQTIRKPVLIVWGERDRVIPVEHGFQAVRTLPDAILAVVPDVGHVPQIEAPDTVTRQIDRFSRSLA